MSARRIVLALLASVAIVVGAFWVFDRPPPPNDRDQDVRTAERRPDDTERRAARDKADASKEEGPPTGERDDPSAGERKRGLVTGARVEGVVRDQHRWPVPGVSVGLRHSPRVETTTDESGRYEIEGIPVGTVVDVRVRDRSGAWSTTPDESRNVEPARVESRDDVFVRDLEVARNPGATVTFVVRFPNGAELPEKMRLKVATTKPNDPGFGVRSTMDYREVEAREQRFDTFLRPGRHVVQFASGHFVASFDLDVAEEQLDLGEIVLPLRERTPVIVQLVAEGRPIRRAGVEISGFGARTDERGRADVTAGIPATFGPDDDVVFRLSGDDVFEAHEESRHAVRIDGLDLEVRMAGASGAVVVEVPYLEALALPVVVRDAAGSPVAGVRVEPSRPGILADEAYVSDERGRLTLRSRKDPRDLFDRDVRATFPWLGHLDVKPWIEGEAAARIDVTRLRRATIRLRDERDQPVAGVRLDGGWERPGRDNDDDVRHTNAEGEATFVIPAARHRMELDAGKRLHIEPIVVEPEETERTVTVFRTRSLALRVRLPETASGAESVYVRAWARGHVVATTAISVDGERELSSEIAVPHWPLRLRLSTKRGDVGAIVDVGARRDAVAIDLARWSETSEIAVRLLTAERRPIANEVAHAEDLTWTVPPVEVRSETDDEGILRLKLPPGPYGTVRFGTAYGRGEATIEAPTSGIIDVVLTPWPD